VLFDLRALCSDAVSWLDYVMSEIEECAWMWWNGEEPVTV